MKIKCFGIAKEITGTGLLHVESFQNGMSVSQMRNYLVNRFPEFQSIHGFMIAVNQEYGEGDMAINDGDEVAIIPPVSGG